MKKFWKWLLARFHLSESAVCELSAGRGTHGDYHDYQDAGELPLHFVEMRCQRCGKNFFI